MNSLPIEPVDSLVELPSALRNILTLAKLEQVVHSDSASRVSLYRLGDSRLVRIEEHLDGRGKLRVLPMDAASLLIRPVDEVAFENAVPEAEKIFPGLFVLDFKNLPELYPIFESSQNLVAAFLGLLQKKKGIRAFSQMEFKFKSIEENFWLAVPPLERSDARARQWNMGDGDGGIHLEGAHKTTKGCKTVVVAVLDNGIRRDHVEFAAPLSSGALLMPVGGNVLQEHSTADVTSGDHGTACASIILAQRSGLLIGVAPNCSLLPVKIMEANDCTQSNAIKGINFARQNQAKVISLSHEVPHATEKLKNVIRACSEILFVVSAGNDRHDLREHPIYPACYALDNMISVISCTEDAGLQRRSNFSPGDEAHVAAPGEYVPHCDVQNDHAYNIMTGTSIAAPHVAGIAALVWSVAPNAKVEDVKKWILKSAVKQKELARKCLTGARVDANLAVGKAVEFLYKSHFLDL